MRDETQKVIPAYEDGEVANEHLKLSQNMYCQAEIPLSLTSPFVSSVL